MIDELRLLLAGIDPQLPAYFLVKGAKAVPVPKSKEEYEKLVSNGYQSLAEGVVYEELSQEVISALHEATRPLGGQIFVPLPYMAVSLLSHEAKRQDGRLQKALSSKKGAAQPPASESEGAEGAQAAKRRSRR